MWAAFSWLVFQTTYFWKGQLDQSWFSLQGEDWMLYAGWWEEQGTFLEFPCLLECQLWFSVKPWVV